MTWGLALALFGLLVGGVSQGFGDADTRSRARQGLPGQWVYSDPTRRSGSGINAQGQVAQVGTIVVDTATNSATYTWTIEGETLTYTADSSTSATEVGDGIVAAINANAVVRGRISASNNAGTVTLTALTPGTAGAFTASDSDAKLTTTESSTAAADASAVPFGRAVVTTGYNTAPTGAAVAESERLVRVPLSTGFTAQVITVTPTYVSGAVIGCSLYRITGSERVFVASAIFASATDLDTTIDGLVAALNTALPANTVLAAANAGTATAFTLTAEILGEEWDVEMRHHSGGASSPTFTVAYTTGPSIDTSLCRAWQGISLYSPVDPATSIAGTAGTYSGNQGVEYATRGVVWVDSTETPTQGGVVYVETVTGSTQGRFYTTGSSTRVALPRNRAQWERDGLVSGDQIAAIRLEA